MNREEPPQLDQHLGYLLRRVSNRVSGQFATSLAERGTTVSEWVCLVQINNNPQLMPRSLAELIGMTQGAVSKICDKLLARNWIKAVGNTVDRRGQFLSLTDEGSRVLPELWQLAEANEQLHFAVLSSEDRANLRRILIHLSQTHNWTDVPTK
ncbi:MAG TPA: MarR family winged helix-turn-helix transcriptional regulator [Fimbriimonas sp.]|nr:MarR family winged helix-turn-helix transcriptional regulator [Fimbriimonas sp.]